MQVKNTQNTEPGEDISDFEQVAKGTALRSAVRSVVAFVEKINFIPANYLR